MTSRSLWALLTCVLSMSCTLDQRRWLADRDEYEVFRQSQVAATLEERLEHAWHYLKKYPQGEFRADVRSWFQRVEADYYLYARPSRKRLKAYLRALPNGPHASEVRARIQELEQAALAEERREQKVLQRVRAVGDRLQAAEKSRQEFVDSVSGWVTRLSKLEGWGAGFEALDPEFLRVFRDQGAGSQCQLDACVRQLTLSYEIPVEKELSERIVVFDVILTLDDGAVVSAELMGPDLFSRLGEAVQRVPVSAEDAQARTEAIGVSRQLLATVLEPRFPEGQCTTEAVSPVILSRSCLGRRVTVIAAPELGGEDRVVFEPTESPASPPTVGSGSEAPPLVPLSR